MRREFVTVIIASLAFLLTGCESTRRPTLYLSHFNLKQPRVRRFSRFGKRTVLARFTRWRGLNSFSSYFLRSIPSLLTTNRCQ